MLPPETGFEPSEAARQAPPPVLLQQPAINAATAPPPPQASAPLGDRIAALRARAAQLDVPVLDPATQSRMQDAVEAR